MSRKFTVADALINYLLSEGIRGYFGLSGEGLIDIEKPLIAAMEDAQGIRPDYIPISNETATGFALGQYYRASEGLVGVGLCTQGVGLGHMDNGLRSLYVDAIPAIIINGQVPVRMQRQATGHYSSTHYLLNPESPFVKAVFSPKNKFEALKCIPHLLNAALGGVPGPVVLELPSDIAAEEIDFVKLERASELDETAPAEKEVKDFVDEILAAKQPMLVFGELLRANEEVAKLAHELTELTNSAWITAFRQFDVLPLNERFGGGLAIVNPPQIKEALGTSEIFVIGHRISPELTGDFADLAVAQNIKWQIYPESRNPHPYCQMAPELEYFGLFNPPSRATCGVKEFLRAAVAELKSRNLPKQNVAEWVKELHTKQDEYSKTLVDNGLFPASLNEIAKYAYSERGMHNVISSDSGLYHHQLNRAQHRHNGFCASPRRAMGQSAGAVGALYGLRHREWRGTIFATMGDGSHRMHKYHLDQAYAAGADGKTNIVACVFDNGGYGNVAKAHGQGAPSTVTRINSRQGNIAPSVMAEFPDMNAEIIHSMEDMKRLSWEERNQHQFWHFDGRKR